MPKALRRLTSSRYLSSGRNSGGYEFDRDVPATGNAGFLEEVRVPLKQLDKVELGLILGGTLRSGARLRGEGDPALADNLFCGNGDLQCLEPLDKIVYAALSRRLDVPKDFG